MQVLARLLLGLPDDLSRRLEQADLADALAIRRVLALSVAAVVVLITVALVPPRLRRGTPVDGTQVMACASEPVSLQGSAEVRLQIMKCAGAFFARRTESTATNRGR